MTRLRTNAISRREFLRGLTLAGAAGFLSLRPRPVAAEPPPETTKLRLLKETGRICWAPQYIAEGTDWRFFNELRKELKG